MLPIAKDNAREALLIAKVAVRAEMLLLAKAGARAEMLSSTMFRVNGRCAAANFNARGGRMENWECKEVDALVLTATFVALLPIGARAALVPIALETSCAEIPVAVRILKLVAATPAAP